MGDVTEADDTMTADNRSNGRISSPQEGQEPAPSHRLRLDLFSNMIMVKRDVVLDPEGDAAYLWSTVVSGMVLFNLWAIIIRIAFVEMRQQLLPQVLFTLLDISTDIIFVIDAVVQFRVGYLEEGIMVKDPLKLALNYMGARRFEFLLDITAAIPLANVYIIVSGLSSHFAILGVAPEEDRLLPHLLRLPKLVKWYSLSQYISEWDMKTNNPNRYRAGKLFVYLALTIHWIGCFYNMISETEGLGVNEWVLQEPTSDMKSPFLRKYLLSIYWSTMTLTTIGNAGNPQTNFEYVFTGLTFLVGVFLFATVVGNVGDVISNMNAARVEFQQKMDSIKLYMKYHRIPSDVQNRIRKWAEYSWNRTQAMDDQTMLDILPFRLRAEIAQHVHLDTLRKVKIFEECEQGLLCELVVRLRSQIYSPSDYICRRGEIGRDMYIINLGRVEVLIPSPDEEGGSTVVATLSEGNYFGEISLLKLEDGCNRRNADVRSVGYSELLVLSKKDLNQALVEYPEARKALEKQARDRMKQTLKEVTARNSLMAGNEANLMEARGGDAERVRMKEREMSEVRHIIRELRAFDSLASKSKQHELETRCNLLEDQLRRIKRELKEALGKLSTYEGAGDGRMERERTLEKKGRWKRASDTNEEQEPHTKDRQEGKPDVKDRPEGKSGIKGVLAALQEKSRATKGQNKAPKEQTDSSKKKRPNSPHSKGVDPSIISNGNVSNKVFPFSLKSPRSNTTFPIRIALDRLSFSQRRMGLCRLVEQVLSDSEPGTESESETEKDVPSQTDEVADESEADEPEKEESKRDTRHDTVVHGCFRMPGKAYRVDAAGPWKAMVTIPAVYVEDVLELESRVFEVDLPEDYVPSEEDQTAEAEAPPVVRKFVIPKIVFNLSDEEMITLLAAESREQLGATAPQARTVSESSDNDSGPLQFVACRSRNVSDCSDSTDSVNTHLKSIVPRTSSVSECSHGSDNDSSPRPLIACPSRNGNDCSDSTDNVKTPLNAVTSRTRTASEGSENSHDTDVESLKMTSRLSSSVSLSTCVSSDGLTDIDSDASGDSSDSD